MTSPLALDIHIAASPATVFKFLTSPQLVVQWLGPGAQLSGSQPGASMKVAYPNGDVAAGELIESLPNQRVTYSWGYLNNAHGLAPGTTRVVFELTPEAAGTHLRLRHEGLSAEQSDSHRIGWSYYAGILSTAAADAELAPLADAAVDQYFAAWAEPDANLRSAILEFCWTDDGEFLDKSTAVRGRAALGWHISAAQAFASGVRLVRDGRISHCQGFVRFGWAAQAGEMVVLRGTNFGQIDSAGRFRFVVGMPE